ncbi:hypothetical protein WT72_32615 [Burkholderia pseudomultivorans]|uniref:gamma-butyrobetaine hydroxylase-like domain-containing protein n=1 Tax=Burkholderia pseudomultivorans TaxID=1207504 RepID=UPI000758BA9F|nr:gamma-butyrobetaine hydroxylase-like domain-containing protein [Burkholderia pseudomultivorans]KWI46539.1 hypothetical protein WT72_32615 [Burkholderia pseudomultivorans]
MTPPTDITLDTAGRAMTLRWPDREAQRVDYARLRRDCPCAECRRIRHDGGSVAVRPDIVLERVEAAGYGIRLVFGDGHARGIYPWSYLAELAHA